MTRLYRASNDWIRDVVITNYPCLNKECSNRTASGQYYEETVQSCQD